MVFTREGQRYFFSSCAVFVRVSVSACRCAQCLGLLGAIDPSRVQPQLPRPSPFKYDGSHFLVCLGQEHLVRVLQTASDISQLEMTSYALQQILQCFTATRVKYTFTIMHVSGLTHGVRHGTQQTRLTHLRRHRHVGIDFFLENI